MTGKTISHKRKNGNQKPKTLWVFPFTLKFNISGIICAFLLFVNLCYFTAMHHLRLSSLLIASSAEICPLSSIVTISFLEAGGFISTNSSFAAIPFNLFFTVG